MMANTRCLEAGVLQSKPFLVLLAEDGQTACRLCNCNLPRLLRRDGGFINQVLSCSWQSTPSFRFHISGPPMSQTKYVKFKNNNNNKQNKTKLEWNSISRGIRTFRKEPGTFGACNVHTCAAGARSGGRAELSKASLSKRCNCEDRQAPLFLELQRIGHTGVCTATGLTEDVWKD